MRTPVKSEVKKEVKREAISSSSESSEGHDDDAVNEALRAKLATDVKDIDAKIESLQRQLKALEE